MMCFFAVKNSEHSETLASFESYRFPLRSGTAVAISARAVVVRRNRETPAAHAVCNRRESNAAARISKILTVNLGNVAKLNANVASPLVNLSLLPYLPHPPLRRSRPS